MDMYGNIGNLCWMMALLAPECLCFAAKECPRWEYFNIYLRVCMHCRHACSPGTSVLDCRTFCDQQCMELRGSAAVSPVQRLDFHQCFAEEYDQQSPGLGRLRAGTRLAPRTYSRVAADDSENTTDDSELAGSGARTESDFYVAPLSLFSPKQSAGSDSEEPSRACPGAGGSSTAQSVALYIYPLCVCGLAITNVLSLIKYILLRRRYMLLGTARRKDRAPAS